MPMSESNKRSRAIAGGMAARSTNRWYYLRKVTGHDKFGQETLECGHAQRAKSDMIGEYDAYRRRCRNCPKPTIPCEPCGGTGAVPGPREVLYRCTDCQGDGRFLAKKAAA